MNHKAILLGLNLFLLLFIGCLKETPDLIEGKILFKVYQDLWGFPPGIYVMDIDGKEIKKIVEKGKMDTLHVSFSTDGSKILVEEGKEIWIMKSDGSERRKLPSGVYTKSSPDGCYYIMNTDGTIIERWSSPPVSPTRQKVGEGISISPTGKKILSIFEEIHKIEGKEIKESGLMIENIDGTEKRKILINSKDWFVTNYFSFSPDGKMIAFETCKESHPIPNAPAEYLYYNMGIVSVDGKEKRILTNYTRCRPLPTFTPDSKRILYYFKGLRSMNLDGTEDRLLTKNVWDYDFTPDGRIIFCGGRPFPFLMKYGIYVMNVDGSGKRKLRNSPRGYFHSFFWPKQEEEKKR